MYAGRVVEDGPAERVLERPTHPYTVALAAADPARARPGARIETSAIDYAAVADELDGDTATDVFADAAASADAVETVAGDGGPSDMRAGVR